MNQKTFEQININKLIISTKEELADLASDELAPILEISEDEAGKIIMAARADWFI